MDVRQKSTLNAAESASKASTCRQHFRTQVDMPQGQHTKSLRTSAGCEARQGGWGTRSPKTEGHEKQRVWHMYDSNTSQSAARKPKGGDLKARATSEQDAPITCDLRVCLARPAHGELALAMHGIAAHTKLQRQEGIPTRGHTIQRTTTRFQDHTTR